MDEMNFDSNRPRYRLVRNNSTDFSHDNNDLYRHQRRSSFVRNTCMTPDSYTNKSFMRLYGQEPTWTFSNCNKEQNSCKCSASTPKIHKMPTDYDPGHEGFVYAPRSHSPSPSIPAYFSLKAKPNKKKDFQQFSESKTLGRQNGKNRSSLVINSNWSPGDNVKNCHSERCLNWLQSSNNFEGMEEQMKELDMNIELLRWKKKHLESVHQQKIQSLHQGDMVNSHHHNSSDSPPPMSDVMKPDISVDDGFESVADTCNNPLIQNFFELELEKQKQRAKQLESMFGKYKSEIELMRESIKKQEIRHQSEMEKMKNYYERRSLKKIDQPDRPTLVLTPSDPSPGSQEKPRAVRPKSFKRELFPACRGGCGSRDSEILNLKAELIIKDQHLKKLRSTLKELSSRHNELLDLHMMLVKSQSKSDSSKDSTQLIEELGHVVEDVQKIFNSVGRAGKGNTPSPATTPSGEQLSKLQQSVEKLKMEVKKRCSDNRQQRSLDDQ